MAGAVLGTERLLSDNPRKVFAAFENPACLRKWWGPIGFTNRFELYLDRLQALLASKDC